jgi:hypothetical protein
MRRLALVICLAMVFAAPIAPIGASGAGAAASPGAEPNPIVTGPITGGIHDQPFMGPVFNLADYGYTENEYFFEGTAQAYGTTDPPAAYETRMIVMAPANQKNFSGKVVVEWDNVTAQADAPADFIWLSPQVLSVGDAYVAVTAQQAGVCGTELTGEPVAGVAPACTPTSLKGLDPVRYAPLFHPGDQYAYDIFSQAMQAIRYPKGISPLGSLKVRDVIAIGDSQSAWELDNYILTGADAAARLANGFLIDSDLNQPEPTTYRVPTLFIWGEDSAQDVTSTSGPNHVAWSVSGLGHTDYWLLQQLGPDLEDYLTNAPLLSASQEEADETSWSDYQQEGPDASSTCGGGEQFPKRYVLDAALTDLESWVRSGVAAPSVPALSFSSVQVPPSATWANVGDTFNTDAEGNALGGLREPWITVPVATYVGNTCPLLGTSTALAPTTLAALYPTHADYVNKMVSAEQAAVHSRFLTVSDAEELLTTACDSAIPTWGTTPTSIQPPVCQNIPAAFQ